MQERAGVIGADFQIISQPEAGTTVFVRLPLGKSSEWRIDHEANPSLGR
jgi:signal transduction histidine kinase